MAIQRLGDLDFASENGDRKHLKVCVVSFFGTAKSGGVGTATSALIRHLAVDGHRVTLLYTLVERGKPINIPETDSGDEGVWSYWVEKFRAEGITLEFIPHEGMHSDWFQKSWLAKEFIGKNDFDLVYFDDWYGIGYYSLLAKRSGLAPYVSQLHCVITHAARHWICETNDDYFSRPDVLEQAGLERRSVEMADVVIGPSQYILREYQNYGWRLPDQAYHQPLPLRTDVNNELQPIPINEIVFFGRLEQRKGLWLFCEAIDRIADKLCGKTVTFLGPPTHSHGISTAMQVVSRSAKWPFRVRLLPNFDSEQAQAYLKRGNKLAVMPSLADNSPCVIYECMESGVPFITTLRSGAEEIIHPDYHPQLMVEPNVQALAERLSTIIADGARRGRPSFDSSENLRVWSAWHRHIAAKGMRLISQSRTAIGANASSAADTALLVIIDDGKSTLGPLIENLISHTSRFGNKATYLILSSRGGAIKGALSDLFKGFSNSVVQIFGPQQLAQVQEAISESCFVFFMDADVEMLTPFFILSLDALGRNDSGVVTCVGGTQLDQTQAAQIDDLPIGNLPGLSAFGRFAGGPVWGIRPPNVQDELSRLELYDDRLDDFVHAGRLGELLMHRCRIADIPVDLIPIVGAITRSDRSGTDQAKNVADTRQYARALGIEPSLSAGQAAWFALSAFGPNSERNEEDALQVYSAALLPRRSMEKSARATDLSSLAATLGRTELALQLEASSGGSAGRLQELIGIAAESIRGCPRLDLTEVLAASGGAMAGTHGAGKGRDAEDSKPAQKSTQELIITYVDPRLEIEGRRVRAKDSLRSGGPGKLFFFDVPLSGQSSIEINLRSSTPDPVFLRARAIDQFTGEEIGVQSVRLGPREPCDLSIPLFNIHGRAAIVLEFSGVNKMDVAAETILVQ